ncbi:MAG: hypothetical protein JXA43_02230 [Candidatus Diapherotrites archaeon]|nr:hypothetical protein [Candidatus Diapherotrites archaeon]
MDQSLSILKSRLKRLHWSDFKAGTIKLVYLPFYVFNYTVFSQSSSGQGDEKVVTAEQTGRKAISSVDAQFQDIVPYILQEQPAKTERETSHSYPVEVVSPSVTEKEVKEVIPARIAAQFQVPVGSVIVSGITMLYLPVWRIWATLGRGTYRIDVDAVLGTVMNEEAVPERERGIAEITLETLDELKLPRNWPKYAKTSAEFIAEKARKIPIPKGSGGGSGPLSSRKWLWYFLILVIVLLVLWMLFQGLGAPASPSIPGGETIIP